MSEAKPTPGPWYAKNHVVHTDAMPKRFWGDANQYSGPYIVMQTGLYSGPDDATTYANARLVAEAGTVFHTTGLTPSQLVERVKELEELLNGVLLMDRMYSGRIVIEGWQEEVLRTALSKARPNTAEGEVARLLRQILAASQDGDSDTHLSAHFVSRIETITKPGGAA